MTTAEKHTVEIAIGDAIKRRGDRFPSGRAALFLTRDSTVFALSTTPIIGNFEAVQLSSGAVVGRSREIVAGSVEENFVSSSPDRRGIDLLSVVRLSNTEVLEPALRRPVADARECYDCTVELVRSSGENGKGRVRDTGAFARLQFAGDHTPTVYNELVEVEAVGGQFGKPGDSGALVRLPAGNELLGVYLGSIAGGIGLVVPLAPYLQREGFSVLPCTRLRADENDALFSLEVDYVLKRVADEPTRLDTLVAKAAKDGVFTRYFSDEAVDVSREQARFVQAAVERLEGEALTEFVRRLESDDLEIDRSGQAWFLRSLLANDNLVNLTEPVDGSVSGTLLEMPFVIRDWSKRDTEADPKDPAPMAKRFSLLAERTHENTVEQLDYVFGEGRPRR